MKPQVSPSFRSAIRIAATVITAAAALHILSRSFVPEGRLTSTSNFSGPAPFVSEAKLPDRVGDPQFGSDGIVRRAARSAPVYLDLKPPANFDSVTVKFRYADAGAKIVELGALASSPDGRFEMRGISHELLNSLSWDTVTSGDLTLYQRRTTFASVDDFLRNAPPHNEVAAYLAEPSAKFRIKDYVPANNLRVISASLRGGHRLLTYVKGEPLSFTFVTQDMNRETGADPVTATVYRIGHTEPVATAKLDDDGNNGDDQKSSKLRTIEVSAVDPGEGAYRIEITATPDVFIREIRTRQSKVSFENWLFLGDLIGYSDQVPRATAFASGLEARVRTPHAEGMQTVRVSDRNLVLDMPNEPVVARIGPGLAEIMSPKRNVLIETDGILALTKEDWFNPLPYQIGPEVTEQDLDRRGINFILARYQTPEFIGESREASATYDLGALAKTDSGAYRFAITASGGADGAAGILLESAVFNLHRDRSGWLRGIFGGSKTENQSMRVLPTGRSFGEKIF